MVDTNEQAARLSAQLRAELVRLGRVDEDGVPLGLQGTVAGVGDLVQARRNGWDLAGLRGQPARADQPRDLPRHSPPATTAASRSRPSTHGDAGRGGGADGAARPYVAEHLALGYASTVHAAQGLTVDTSHAVVTARTGCAALYVALTRGRDANTAHVATIADRRRPGPGQRRATRCTATRSPSSPACSTARPSTATLRAGRSPPSPPTRPQSVRTPAELLADAAAAGRRPSAPPAGSTSSPTTATSPRAARRGSPPRTAPPR